MSPETKRQLNRRQRLLDALKALRDDAAFLLDEHRDKCGHCPGLSTFDLERGFGCIDGMVFAHALLEKTRALREAI